MILTGKQQKYQRSRQGYEIKKYLMKQAIKCLIYYFKNNTATKDLNDFENGIEFFRKIESVEMKLEDAKEMQNIFKTNLK